MFDHVKCGASDYAASKAFFLKALAPLGVTLVSEGPPAYGAELAQPEGKVSLCLFETQEKPAHLHIAFTAATRAQSGGGNALRLIFPFGSSGISSSFTNAEGTMYGGTLSSR